MNWLKIQVICEACLMCLAHVKKYIKIFVQNIHVNLENVIDKRFFAGGGNIIILNYILE